MKRSKSFAVISDESLAVIFSGLTERVADLVQYGVFLAEEEVKKVSN